MEWKKLGLTFCADKHHDWMVSHAANPVAEHIEGDLYRIYFSCRDIQNRSSIGFIELDITSPQQILKISDTPVLSPGKAGLFDDSGTSMACVINYQGKRLLYYLGWNLGVTVPWRNSIGLAVSFSPTGPFVRYSRAPIMDRNPIDPFSISYPWVIEDNSMLKMWYGSNLNWGERQEDMAHILKYAESSDGLSWRRSGHIAINFKTSEEYAISKPCILKEDGIYKMWYSFRGHRYRIGYAESHDGIHWVRMDDKAGISVSEHGWDSEAISYPHVFTHKDTKYMLYNGNRYGLTGFGLAILEI